MRRAFASRRWLGIGAATAAAAFAVAFLPLSADGSSAQREAWKARYHRPAEIPFPDDNPYSKAKDDLGRMLFFDPIMSASGTLSCASCHNPALSWSDGLPRAIGESRKPLALRAPTILNVAWVSVLGWDGKFRRLERVPFEGPVTSPGNMNRKPDELMAALNAIPGYRQAFAAAFPDSPAASRETVEEALATFQRTVVSSPAPFDRWIDGDESAIGDAAKRGFDLFNGKASCAECHSGWNFTDGSFHDIGTADGNDIGRARLFPSSTKLRYAFKTPTLRDVARRGPYMHDGSEATLAAVIDLYDRGGIDRPSRSELMKPLKLSDGEKADLIAFLETLTGEPTSVAVPRLPR